MITINIIAMITINIIAITTIHIIAIITINRIAIITVLVLCSVVFVVGFSFRDTNRAATNASNSASHPPSQTTPLTSPEYITSATYVMCWLFALLSERLSIVCYARIHGRQWKKLLDRIGSSINK